MKNLITNVIYSVCFLFLLGANNSVYAQTAVADFLIVIKTTEKGVELNCLQGCNFKDLTFTLNGDEAEAVNNDGMTTGIVDLADRVGGAIPSDYFHFTVERNADGVLLKGIHGTNWEKLEIKHHPGLTQAFNQNGPVY